MKPGMLKKKASADRQKGVEHAASRIEAAQKADVLEHKMTQVALANIQIWQDQPRTFLLTMEDIYTGFIKDDDENRIQKLAELEGIISLSISQQLHGIMNAPVAYDLPGQNVQLIGGQRRTMAAAYAALHLVMDGGEPLVDINPEPDLKLLEEIRIHVKVYLRKPDLRTIKRLGIIDNTQRVNLPLPDLLRWAIEFADDVEAVGDKVSHHDLVDALGISRSQAFEWLKILKTRKDKWMAKAIELALSDKATFNQLKALAAANANERAGLFEQWFMASPSADFPKVSLGVSNNLSAIEKLVMLNIDEKDRATFAAIDWSNPKQTKKGFAEFLRYWEAKHV